jgi:hypothetical protein
MGVKNKNQIKKALVLRRKADKEKRRLEFLSIKQLPEAEKIKLEMSDLEYYINIRYKNDKDNRSKVILYQQQLDGLKIKLKEVIENGQREAVQDNVLQTLPKDS